MELLIQKNSNVAKLAFFTNQITIDKLKYESNSFVISHSIEYKEFKLRAKTKNPSINVILLFIFKVSILPDTIENN